MGTNYYLRNNICKCCGRSDEREHLGKSSGGWDFSIHHIDDKFNSWNEFFEYTKNGRIFNEYGEEISHKDFIDFINVKKEAFPFAHKKEYDPYGKYIDGYYFLRGDFF